MRKQFIKQILEILNSQKSEILKKTLYDQDVDMSGDETDEIQANILLNNTKSLLARDSEKLNLIDQAFKKIQDGSFGTCEECDEQIPDKRLLFNPVFKMCVLCAEAEERYKKQHVR